MPLLTCAAATDEIERTAGAGGGPGGRTVRTRPTSSTRTLLGVAVALGALILAGPAAYVVQRGDTLSGIAARHGVSTTALAAANGISDIHHIVAGAELVIPGEGPAEASPAPPPAGGARYRVRPGDTLSGIAARHGVSTTALAAANGISDIHHIVAGAVLTVPAAADASVPMARPATTHVIAPGETLSQIAARYDVSLRALADANGIIDVHRIIAGTRLVVPAADLAPPSPTATPAGSDASRFPARLAGSPARLALVPVFEHWAGVYGAPVDLLMAMTWLESGWQNSVVSPVGARGIGQLMPDTVTWMRDVLIGDPTLDAGDPSDNIQMSARYLGWLLERTGGDVATALGGYYQGLGSVRARGLLPVTEVYVQAVLAVRDRHF